MRAGTTPKSTIECRRFLSAAMLAACVMLASGAVKSQSATSAQRLEAHIWPKDVEEAPLTAGAVDDLWTISGSHYRFDGTKLGQLTFSDRLAGQPEAIRGIRVGAQGQVFVVGVWPALGWSLSAHDQTGQQRWITALGRASATGSARGSGKTRWQHEPPPEIAWAEILGVDEAGSVRISGWLQGCVDLAPRPASRVDCATPERAGKNFVGDVDAFPQLLFTSTFDDSGRWKGSRTFPRLHARAMSWSKADGSLAATVTGWWTKPLAFQAPAGTPASIPFAGADPPFKSIVVLLDRAGRLRGAHHFLAHEGPAVRSLTFDERGWLWMLAAYSPGIELRGPGGMRIGASVANCLSLVSLAETELGKKNLTPYFHASFCTPYRSTSIPSTVSTGPGGRIIISWAPASMFEGEPLEPPADLAPPPPPRDVLGNVPRDFVPTRLVVTRQGRLEWSSPIQANHAIGLPNGWVCFETLTQLACVRPTDSASSPGSALGSVRGSAEGSPRQGH